MDTVNKTQNHLKTCLVQQTYVQHTHQQIYSDLQYIIMQTAWSSF